MSLLLTFDIFHTFFPFSTVSVFDFEQTNTSWVLLVNDFQIFHHLIRLNFYKYQVTHLKPVSPSCRKRQSSGFYIQEDQ